MKFLGGATTSPSKGFHRAYGALREITEQMTNTDAGHFGHVEHRFTYIGWFDIAVPSR